MTLSVVETSALQVVPSPVVLLRTRDVPHAERWVASGELVRVQRGVLAAASDWRELPPWSRYLARVHGFLLSHPEAVPCLESAAALLGLPVFGDPFVVHVLDTTAAGSRQVGGIRTHTTAGDREIVQLGGIRLVGPVDTAVDMARGRHHAVGLSVADAVLRSDPDVRVEMLVAANESRLNARGRRHARWVLHRATDVAETALESVSRAVVEWMGFDDPVLQQWFTTDGRRDRVDMWWPDAGVVGESDGDLKYDGSMQPGVAAIRDEKERDRRLSRHARAIAHWGWADLRRIDPLREALRRAGLRPHHPEDSRQLASLRAALSPTDRESPSAHRNGWVEPTVSARSW